ncbi:MAG: COG4223 family protein [Alphaproteobacteria bacterium]
MDQENNQEITQPTEPLVMASEKPKASSSVLPVISILISIFSFSVAGGSLWFSLRPQQPATDNKTLLEWQKHEDTLKILENKTDDLKKAVTLLETQKTSDTSNNKPIDTESQKKADAAIQQQIDALKLATGNQEVVNKSLAGQQALLSTLQDSLRNLEKKQQLQDQNLITLEKTVHEKKKSLIHQQLLLIGLIELQKIESRGAVFDKALESLKKLASDDEEVLSELQKLEEYGSNGVANISTLEKKLQQLAPEIVRSQYLKENGSWWEQTLYQLSTVISIRRLNETGQNDETVDAVIARALGNMQEENLSAATEEISSLEGLPSDVSKNWLEEAKARIILDETTEQIFQLIVKRLAESDHSVSATDTTGTAP